MTRHCIGAYLALNLDVIRDELDISSYYVVPTAKQVLGERTGAVSNCPAGSVARRHADYAGYHQAASCQCKV